MTISKQEEVRRWDEHERTLDEKMMRQLQQQRWQQALEEKRKRERKE